ncbi:hypothetical protein [Zooshikella harenae]|uniref:DUF3019 domain-containing protein n=1 Tax=Zooshikella harenae TaxID=2827238 RepID=A0ABS5ZLU6_9GAMM|nr:hypothetical protein [Zooshikella harenae]MBU2714207.1 hypothetical protein [Zooshikella harenae]
MKKLAVFLVPLIFLSTSFAEAEEPSWTQIKSVGCHTTDTTCFVEISGNFVGPSACKSNSLRWNRKTSPNGNATLSLLTTAFAAGNLVSFQVAEECYQDQPNYPTFRWFNIKRD